MEIVSGFPPNINELKEHFDIGYTVVFTYGDILYNPGNGFINKALLAHEETHSRQQQEMGVEQWWRKYIDDQQFRIDQEVEAYHNQYLEYKKSNSYQKSELFVNNLARDLSSKLYGENIIDFKTALNKIKYEKLN